MAVYLDTMKQVAYSSFSWLSTQAEYLGKTVVSLGGDAVGYINSTSTDVAGKIATLWNESLPHLETAGKCLGSNLGLSAISLTIALPILYLARSTENRILSIALTMIGVSAAVASGVFLVGSGLLPPIPTLV